jgi:serine/threonine protein kinase
MRAGDELGDRRFRLIDEVGRGDHGIIWKAFDRRRDVLVAVKILHPHIASDGVRREQFFRAARLMSELQHPAVVRVIEPRGEEGGSHYFVMEWVPGGDFRRAVLEKKLMHADVLSLIITVGEALAHLNSRGFAHLDIKPSNIVLSDSGQPVLTDFGLLLSPAEEEEPTSGPLGAPLYAAPECRNSLPDAGARSDVYGLGMTAIFGLHGSELPPYAILGTEDILRDSACSSAWLTCSGAQRAGSATNGTKTWERSARLSSGYALLPSSRGAASAGPCINSSLVTPGALIPSRLKEPPWKPWP